MSPLFPTPQVLLVIVLVGEACLMRNRLSSDVSRKADRGSLRMLFIIIFGSVGLAWLAARGFPQARFESLLGLDPMAMKRLYWVGLGLFAAGVSLRWYSIASAGSCLLPRRYRLPGAAAGGTGCPSCRVGSWLLARANHPDNSSAQISGIQPRIAGIQRSSKQDMGPHVSRPRDMGRHGVDSRKRHSFLHPNLTFGAQNDA